MSMFFEEDFQFLMDIGLTKTQAKTYLSLLKLGETDGNSLAKNAEVSRQIVYRTLDQLQEKGLVEKKIGRPYKFRATPLKHGLQIIMSQRRRQYQEIREKAKVYLKKMQNYQKATNEGHKYTFTYIEGRERIIQLYRLYHKRTKLQIEGITTLPRFSQIVHYSFKEFILALNRKVKIRVVMEKPKYKYNFSEEIKALLAKPNFKLKFSNNPLRTNLAVFDNKETTINYFPSKPLGESPILVTNHPSFTSMAQDHFKLLWKSSEIE